MNLRALVITLCVQKYCSQQHASKTLFSEIWCKLLEQTVTRFLSTSELYINVKQQIYHSLTVLYNIYMFFIRYGGQHLSGGLFCTFPNSLELRSNFKGSKISAGSPLGDKTTKPYRLTCWLSDVWCSHSQYYGIFR